MLEDGALTYPDTGTPQGGVVSPLLANIFLHEVLDKWFHGVVVPRLRGRAFLIRFADDFVIVCAEEDDARTIMTVLPKRLGKYGLTLHPEKTRLVPFRRPRNRDQDEPGTFDLLGFTHFWAKSRKGRWVVKRSTAKKRLTRSLRSIADWCNKNLHEPVAFMAAKLGQKLRGHCQYYGITGNSQGLQRFRRELLSTWWRALNRRTRGARLTWERFKQLLGVFPIPPAQAVHSVCRPPANL